MKTYLHNTPEGAEKEKKKVTAVSAVTAFFTTFMGSALNLSIPDIGKEFRADTFSLSWVVTIYLLACTALAVPFGKVADAVDRKKIFITGIFVFMVSSAAAAASPGLSMLLALRLVQGTGAAMIFSTGTAMVAAVSEADEQGKLLGYVTGANYLGLSAGPAAGGMLTAGPGWRFIFLTAAAVSAAAFFFALRNLPPGRKHQDRKIRFRRKIYPHVSDFILYIFGISGFMWGLSALQKTAAGWISLAAGAGALLFLFFRNPCEIIRNPSFLSGNVSAFCNYGANFAMSYLLSLYLQLVAGCSSRISGLVLICAPAVQALLSPVTGHMSDWISPWKLAASGTAVTAVVLAGFGFLPSDASPGTCAALFAAAGLGCSCFAAPNTRQVLSSAGMNAGGTASAVLSTMRSAGHTAAMAVNSLLSGILTGNCMLEDADPAVLLHFLHSAFFLFSALCIFGCIFGFFMARKEKM